MKIFINSFCIVISVYIEIIFILITNNYLENKKRRLKKWDKK